MYLKFGNLGLTSIEAEGKLILFNPPPFGPYNCPLCGTKLKEKFESL